MKNFFLLLAALALIGLSLIPRSAFERAKKFDSQEYLAKTNNADRILEVKQKYGKMIGNICRKERINPAITADLIEKIIIIESSGNPGAMPKKSGDGIGLMGVEPVTAGVSGVRPDSLKVPYWNLLAGIRYLNSLVNSLRGDIPAALVAYNCGIDKYRKNYAAAGIKPEETRRCRQIAALSQAEKQLACNQ